MIWFFFAVWSAIQWPLPLWRGCHCRQVNFWKRTFISKKNAYFTNPSVLDRFPPISMEMAKMRCAIFLAYFSVKMWTCSFLFLRIYSILLSCSLSFLFLSFQIQFCCPLQFSFPWNCSWLTFQQRKKIGSGLKELLQNAVAAKI